MKQHNGWIIDDSATTWKSYTKGNWKIVRFSRTDWSVYLIDEDGTDQYQLQYRTLREAMLHCGG